MEVKTTRFGLVEVDAERVIRFADGFLGFPDCTEFVLLQTNDEGNFFWLQALNQPEVAFVTCDPLLFVPDYQIPVKAEEFEQIGLASMADAQVLIIVNKVGKVLTGNLQGPLLINALTRCGKQLVLSEKKYSTRHPLLELATQAEQVSRTA